MKPLLEQIVRSLVDNPDAVSVNPVPARNCLLLRLSVAEADRIKVVGKQGRTIRALETYMQALGRRQGQRIRIDAGRAS